MSDQVETQNEITVTVRAIAQINNIRDENNLTNEYCLRIGVKGGGCSGLTYHLGFDKESRESDTIIEKNGVKIIVDGKSLFY